MKTVLNTLEAKACFDGEEQEVYLRLAQYEDRIYLDLGTPEWNAVEIDTEGWRVVSSPPVRFRRPDTLLPHPIPVAGGTLEELWQLLNVDEESRILVVSWLLFCFCPLYPHPLLALHGEQGSGKSVTATILKSLVDPGKSPLIPQIADLRNLSIAANNRWILAFDNLSGLNAEQSDALCRIATGGGFTTRTLHKNAEETVFEFIRPQILTGIDSLATRGDLLSRSLLVWLKPISDGERRTEAKLQAALEQARPQILGVLLTALSQTLRTLPTVKHAPSRLADFAKFAIAAESALGFASGSFLAAYQGNQQEAHTTAVESSPVAVALGRFLARRQSWKGTASDLLRELEALTDETTRKSRSWAGDPRRLGKALVRLAPDLRGIGIDVWQGHSSSRDRRLIRLEKLMVSTSDSSVTVQFSASARGAPTDKTADKEPVASEPKLSTSLTRSRQRTLRTNRTIRSLFFPIQKGYKWAIASSTAARTKRLPKTFDPTPFQFRK